MNQLLLNPVMNRLGLTLFHSLWQGALILLITLGILRLMRNASANARYLTLFIALACTALAPLSMLRRAEIKLAPTKATISIAATPAPMVEQTTTSNVTTIATIPEKISVFSWCGLAWIIGVAALSLWHAGGLLHLRKLKTDGTSPIPEALAQKTAELARQLGIKRAVRLLESTLVHVPTLIGWLKPMILLPTAAISGLTPEQLEALIAHELAHIKRHDFLFNLAQTLIDILFFYHPAIWYISRQLRKERENCCDDLAVDALKNRKLYAESLYSMAQLHGKPTSLAMAANGGELTERISRLAGKTAQQKRRGQLAAALVSFSLLCTLFVIGAAAKSLSSAPIIGVEEATAIINKARAAAGDYEKIFDQLRYYGGPEWHNDHQKIAPAMQTAAATFPVGKVWTAPEQGQLPSPVRFSARQGQSGALFVGLRNLGTENINVNFHLDDRQFQGTIPPGFCQAWFSSSPDNDLETVVL